MEGMNFVDQEPGWQAFEGTPRDPLPESSLMGPALEYASHSVSHSPRRAVGYNLEPYDTLSTDCILTPVSLEGELDISYSDSTPLPWPTPYAQYFELPPISSESSPLEVAKGVRREVSLTALTRFFLS